MQGVFLLLLWVVMILCSLLWTPVVGAEVMEPESTEAGPEVTQWKVRVNGTAVPVYSAVVFFGGPAYFCCFETDGPVRVEVEPAWPVRQAVVRPLATAITPTVTGHVIAFDLDGPCNVSVEVNGLIQHPLFLFASPVEKDIPDPEDPNVIYFGPGVHRVDRSISIKSGQEVYLAPGAWVRAVMPCDEEPVGTHEASGMHRYKPLFHASDAREIQVHGSGVIDLSALDWVSRSCMGFVRCKNLRISGVTVIDCPAWTVVVAQSEDVVIDGVKLIGHRESNDGIDLLNSQRVTVRNCFTRIGDDGIVIKTFPGGGASSDVLVEKCVIWNDKVRAIGITSETAEPIKGITFRDIDVIHDLAASFDMAWTLAVYMEDCGPISDVLFEDIRCEDVREQFIQIAITKGQWATTDTLGSIERVTFRNVRCLGENLPRSEIRGNDPVNGVRDVLFENLVVGGRLVDSAESGHITLNEFTSDIRFVPSP